MKVYLISILTVTFFFTYLREEIYVRENKRNNAQTPGYKESKRTWVMMSNIWLLVKTGNLKKTKELSV